MIDGPATSGDSPQPPLPPPPPHPESVSISSMVASSAASAAAAAADLTRRGEAFGADMAAAARAAMDTAIAHSQSSAISAAEAASSAKANALAAFPGLSLIAKEELEWIKNEHTAHEQMVFGKIKEGAIMATGHPGIAAGSTAIAGIVLFKRPRSYLVQRVWHIFVSKETLLSGIQAEVNHIRQTVNLVSNESQKLLDRAATAEKRFQKGWNTLREEGRAIQSEQNQISDIEKQAVGLKSILNQLPRAHASEFRSEISGLASQVTKEKRVLNNILWKIVNYGVPV